MRSLQIRVAQHPEWDEDRVWQEAQKIYKDSTDTLCCVNNKIFIIPVKDDKPVKLIYEGGQYEKQLYEIRRN